MNFIAHAQWLFVLGGADFSRQVDAFTQTWLIDSLSFDLILSCLVTSNSVTTTRDAEIEMTRRLTEEQQRKLVSERVCY